MDKVYLVVSESGDWDDYNWSIEVICKNLRLAELNKKLLEEQKAKALKEYLTIYGNEFYKDLREIQCDDLLLTNEGLYDEIVNRIYSYQAKNKIVSKKFKIQEREII